MNAKFQCRSRSQMTSIFETRKKFSVARQSDTKVWKRNGNRSLRTSTYMCTTVYMGMSEIGIKTEMNRKVYD